jgi:uncharacterized protein YicC (UPF0701 family)
VIVNGSEGDTNVNKLDEKVDRLDREIHQVKDALNENNDEMKKQQRKNIERINQKVHKGKLETESQFAWLH